MNNKKYFQVARWEYIEKLKSKAFIISLFLTPLIMIASTIIPSMLATRSDTSTKVIGVIDQSGEVVQPLSKMLEDRYKLPDGQPNYLLTSIPFNQAAGLAKAKATADSLVLAEAIEGYTIIGQTVMRDSSFEYRSQNVGNFKVISRLQDALRDLIIEKKLNAEGLDPKIVKELTTPIELKTIRLSQTGKEEESGFAQVFFTSFIFMMMMFVLVLTSGQLLVRSMLEEKSNRVVEVLMSSCSATNLMAGKILGLSALGLTQIGLWVIIGVAISLNFAITLIPLTGALLLLVYFILGYLLFAAIFVAAGAPVSTEQEAQQITSYLTLILIIPIMLAMMIIQDPNSVIVKVLSFIPLLTPSMMAMRIPLQMPSTPEIIITLVVLALSAWAAIWFAGKVFRTTILMYGKRPSIREMLAMIRVH